MTTLYLKYRPQTIDDLDLTDVRESLKKIVASGKIPHALLFYGPKGSGKTSAARIIAKAVNCLHPKADGEPCNKCEVCLSITKGVNIDVIELDAASHRGVDDARMIRDAVKLSPARAKKKVYIIDEAHMLTAEASNSLLKTIEEPPEHVLFILATTNPEKLIDTIKSRTLNINFAKAGDDEIIRSISKTLKGEGLKVDKKSLKLIAKVSDGSFREANKIVENIITKGLSFTEEVLEKELFKNASYSSVEDIIKGLAKSDDVNIVGKIEKLVRSGAKVENLTANLIERLKSALFSKMGLGGEDLPDISKDELVELIEIFNRSYSQISRSYLEQIPLETAVIKWCRKNPKGGGSHVEEVKIEYKKKENAVRKVDQEGNNSKSKIEAVNSKDNGCIPDDIWKQIIMAIKLINTSTEALLRAARPVSYDGKILTLGVYYSFHKERLEEVFHKRILEDTATKIMGSQVKVECQLSDPPNKVKDSIQEDINSNSQNIVMESNSVLTEPDDEDIIKIAKEIFGG